MGIAKLPFHLSHLENELSACIKDLNTLSKRLTVLQQAFIFPQSSIFFKQQKASVLLFLEPSAERTIYQRVLEESEFWVEIVDTLEGVCNVLHRGFDLVLFDFDQAGMDAVTQLKKSQEKSMPQLVALTAFAPPFLKVMGLKNLIQKPADAYLIKIPLLKILAEIAKSGGQPNV